MIGFSIQGSRFGVTFYNLYGLELPLVHEIIKVPHLLIAFLSHTCIHSPDSIETDMGKPDLADRDQQLLQDQLFCDKEDNGWINLFVHFCFDYSNEGHVIILVKCHDNKALQLDTKLILINPFP